MSILSERLETVREGDASGTLFRLTFYAYVFLTSVVAPILTPLRTFEIWNAAYLVYANVGFVALFIFCASNASFFVPTRFFQFLLIGCLLMGMLIGLPNIQDETSLRNYASHAFQLISAYVMFSLGRSLQGELWNENMMRLLMLGSIAGDMIGTVATYAFGIQFGLGGYLVGGASSFIALCYFLSRSRLLALVAFIAVFLTGKRGPFVASLVVWGVHFMLPGLRERFKGISVTTLLVLSVGLVGSVLTVSWFRPDVADGIVQTLEDRVESIPKVIFDPDEDERLAVAGGRYEEIAALFEDYGFVDWLVGRGFGYEVSYIREGDFVEIHEAHFTPATLTVRFGLPLAAIFLGIVVTIIVSGLRRRVQDAQATQAGLTRQRETILLYAIGQLLISLTAFTFFVDLYFMLFVGVISSWTTNRMHEKAP